MTESEQAQAPTWGPWIVVPGSDKAAYDNDPLADWQITRRSSGHREEFFGGFQPKEDCEEDAEILNALQTSLSEANAEVTRLRGALEARERIAQFLFARLDDIDTIDDAAKGDDKSYRSHVRRIQKRRFEVATTDGYTVTWKEQTDAV